MGYIWQPDDPRPTEEEFRQWMEEGDEARLVAERYKNLTGLDSEDCFRESCELQSAGLNLVIEEHWGEVHRMQDRIDTQAERVAELEGVLDFYADANNYRPTGWQGDQDPAKVSVDGGRQARAALDGAKGGE